MYICICKGITEKQLKDAASLSKGSKQEAMKRLGVGSDCGSCIEFALDKLMEDQVSSTYHDSPGQTPFKSSK